MGGFYGSIQLRTADRPRVLAAAEAVASELGIKCLVGPALNGWVGVYPEGHGQDHTVGARLAAAVGGHALHLLVHDDDVLAYWLWADGQLVDRYWSAPGYFGDANRAEEEPLAGDPGRFAFVLDEGGRAGLLNLLQRRKGRTFESQRLEELGRLLHIRNAVTAFEHLDGGDAHGVTGWPRRFSKLPAADVRAERARRAAEKASIKVERSRLRAAGLLLAFEERPKVLVKGCTAADGFIVVWQGFLGGSRAIEHYRPPWKSPSRQSELAPADAAFVGDLASDDGGRIIAVPSGNAVRFWEWSGGNWRAMAHRFEGHGAHDLAFSSDGRWVAYKRNEPRELVAAKVDGTMSTQMPRLAMDRQVAFSPDGKWVVLAGMTLGIFDISNGHEQGPTGKMFRVTRLRRLIPVPTDGRGSEHCFCVGFDTTGRWLWVGTDLGLRVYEWSALTAGTGEEPISAVRTFDMPLTQTAGRDDPTSGYVYAASSEPKGTGVVFRGSTSELFHMDLSTGEVRRLMAPLEGGTIFGLAISADGKALGVCSSLRDRHGLTIRSTWEVWDYPRLFAGRDDLIPRS